MDNQLDEAGNIIQRGLGKVAGAIGAVAGVPAGMARAFKAGKAQGAEAVGGADTTAPADTASAAETGQTATDSNSIKQQIAQKKAEIAELEKQLTTNQSTASSAPAGPVGKTAPGPDTSTVGNAARAVGDKLAGGINAATDALKAGQGMGTSMQSLAQVSEPNKGSVKIKDANGQEHAYKKVGQQWFDSENKPVNAAQAAMLDKQADQQAALGKTKAPAEPVKIGGDALDPNNPADAKIIAQVQKQQGGATAQPDTAEQPMAPAKTKNYDPNTGQPLSDKAKADKAGMDAFDASPEGKALQAKWDAEDAAAAQSPEEIRKTKQATAATTAQGQMAANPAPAQQPAAVWKNNRAPEGTPAATSPQAAATAATAQQPADKQPNDVMARMAKQLAPAQTATPNFGQQQPGYASVKMNVPTGIPQTSGPQPTTGAKAVPVQQPAAEPAPTASAQADAGKPGFLQSKIKGSQVPAKQPEMAGTDFSAMLARKAKVRL